MRTRRQSRSHEEDRASGSSEEAVSRIKRETPSKVQGVKGRQIARSLQVEAKEEEEEVLIRKKAKKGLVDDISLRRCTSRNAEKSSPNKEKGGEEIAHHSTDISLRRCTSRNAETSSPNKEKGGEEIAHHSTDEFDWEEGSIPVPGSGDGYSHDRGKELTIEFTDSPSSCQRKRVRRASAEEKELAELVHKVHLLCLLARGMLVDKACDDPLIQASLLSLLPSYMVKIVDSPKLTARSLGSLVGWFHQNFHVQGENFEKKSFNMSLAFALESRTGTVEEISALSVALFRALRLTARFILVLDVASLKPDADMCEDSKYDTPRLNTRIFSSNTTVSSPAQIHSALGNREQTAHETLERGKRKTRESNPACKKNLLKGLVVAGNLASTNNACSDNFEPCATKSAEGSKRKGDAEFEMQLEMAISSTAAGVNDSSSDIFSSKRMRKTKNDDSPVSSHAGSSTVWARKVGPPLCWAEVYCSGEALTGRWVHIDAANGIVDGEDKVEAALAAWRRPLKYVAAFAGNGAKDVTRRYCTQWYKIATQRVSSNWWDTVLAPLKELESVATGSILPLTALQHDASSQETFPVKIDLRDQAETSSKRNSLEDMELETRALTEPLPTNQLAYKNHHLYAIERWLLKNQVLRPRGPVLGYCSGHPVYPRSCVQTLQRKHKWLCEGLQVKANEAPAKVVKNSRKFNNPQSSEPGASEEVDGEVTVELYGKWQVEPLQLPHAVNGIVPKNERGQVDVWSEKCLPPGTVHLRLPRLVPVARRLEIDFAPAMVGFEFRNGRFFPIFEGIVVCTEFKDAIIEAYAEVEQRREAEERKQTEQNALNRWFQLLSSIFTRKRLEDSYNTGEDQKKQGGLVGKGDACVENATVTGATVKRRRLTDDVDHEHFFALEDQSYDEESSIRTKRCPCGFSIQVEEL